MRNVVELIRLSLVYQIGFVLPEIAEFVNGHRIRCRFGGPFNFNFIYVEVLVVRE